MAVARFKINGGFGSCEGDMTMTCSRHPSEPRPFEDLNFGRVGPKAGSRWDHPLETL